jgi:hypothetical protein
MRYSSRLVSRSSEDQASFLVSNVCEPRKPTSQIRDGLFAYDEIGLREP